MGNTQGSQDINAFRSAVHAGAVPAQTAITYNGYFNEFMLPSDYRDHIAPSQEMLSPHGIRMPAAHIECCGIVGIKMLIVVVVGHHHRRRRVGHREIEWLEHIECR